MRNSGLILIIISVREMERVGRESNRWTGGSRASLVVEDGRVGLRMKREMGRATWVVVI